MIQCNIAVRLRTKLERKNRAHTKCTLSGSFDYLLLYNKHLWHLFIYLNFYDFVVGSFISVSVASAAIVFHLAVSNNHFGAAAAGALDNRIEFCNSSN